MLYTLSRADYDINQLQAIISQLTENDALLLWQDGVLQAVKKTQIFAKIPNLFILENDLIARGLESNFPKISLQKFVELTEQYYPHIAL